MEADQLTITLKDFLQLLQNKEPEFEGKSLIFQSVLFGFV